MSIALIGGWERWGKNALMYEEIPVLKSDAQAGTVIDSSMIEYRRFERGALDFLSKGDEGSIIGMETSQFVHGQMPLFKEYFRNPRLSGSMEQGRFQINLSDNWIESVPSDLARGNRIHIYSGKSFVTSAYVAKGYEEGKGTDIIAESSQIAAIGEIVDSGGKLILVKG